MRPRCPINSHGRKIHPFLMKTTTNSQAYHASSMKHKNEAKAYEDRGEDSTPAQNDKGFFHTQAESKTR